MGYLLSSRRSRTAAGVLTRLMIAACLSAALSGCTAAADCSEDGWCHQQLGAASWLAVVPVEGAQAVAVDRSGRTARFTGSGWIPGEALAGSVAALSSNGVAAIAVGDAGRAWRWQEERWEPLSDPAIPWDLTHVWIGPDGTILAAGKSAPGAEPARLVVLRHDRGGWHPVWQLEGTGDGEITALCGASADAAMAVGVIGAGPAALIVRANAGEWVDEEDLDRGLPATCVPQADGVVVVDRELLDVRRESPTGATYLDRECGPDGCEPNATIDPAAVVDADGTLVLVGDVVYETVGDALKAPAIPAAPSLTAVAAGPGAVLAVGRSGTILRRAGSRWTVEHSGVTADLAGAAVVGDHLLAVGDQGALLWKRVPSSEVD